MRLKQIKIAGFKSFVDPTSFDVPGQLVGVVGPNGCGKSNIIDAVRWVLGESKASELRGESMQDVIFSGASDRRPASRASVELVFDNSSGRIGGSWAAYGEISVRRVLTRDGQSSYQINHQPVRRRDVHDMFLGTGLGPRAYAIIGQGMISRIIEARPEELRIFLEEAAGVSKYKERRRESAARLADTRENLVRVDDIERELTGQIERLQRQAEVARRYREAEEERERKQRMLWLVRRDDAGLEHERVARMVAEAATALEGQVAAQRQLESEIELIRVRHHEGTDAVHAAQGRYYEANTEVGRIEGEIRLVSQTSGQLRERIAALGRQIEAAQVQAEGGTRERAEAQAQLGEAQLLQDQCGQRVATLAGELPQCVEALRVARQGHDEARAAVAEVRRELDLCAARRHAAEASIDSIRQRQQRLRIEAEQLVRGDPVELERVRAALVQAQQVEHDAHEQLGEAQSLWEQADAGRSPAQQELRDAEGRLAQVQARHAALRQVQEQAESHARGGPWFARHGLDKLRRLWQRIVIVEGWENAVEAVLRERINALELSRLEHGGGFAGDRPPTKVTFFSPSAAAAGRQAPEGFTALATLVKTDDPAVRQLVDGWLDQVFVAENVEAALAQRGHLATNARLVTREGDLIGGDSLQYYAPDSDQEGVLARRHELEVLEREALEQRTLAELARSQAGRVEALAAQRMAAQSSAREAHAAAVRGAATLRLEYQRLEQEDERSRSERARVDLEQGETEQSIAGLMASADQLAQRFDEFDGEFGGRQQHAEETRERVEAAEQELARRREELRAAENESQEASFAVRSIGGAITRHGAAIEEANRRRDEASGQLQALEAQLAALSAQPAEQALEAALTARLDTERALAAAREASDGLTVELREAEERRLGLVQEQEPLRQRSVDLGLREQAARLNREQYQEQLLEASVDADAELELRAAFPQSPRPSWLQGEVNRLTAEIAGFGAVNLAALDELTQAQERESFLAAQSADLREAMNTLEDAIRRIDRETRSLLQSTYDAVNSHFGVLFPQLFGGGEARLVMTGEEILDAGIQVMAQPPGKRNTSIHVLSGGEKALTAIALVFALFQLNPAPFCLLDEVDAPLDEANTQRYCDMVRAMAGETQFLFITHNKMAMELAQQLIGVTMQERGVSRIVAVDLDSAANLAEVAA